MAISKESVSIFPVTGILSGSVLDADAITESDARVSTRIVAWAYKLLTNVHVRNDG